MLYLVFLFLFLYKKEVATPHHVLTQKERCLKKYSKISLFFERPNFPNLSHKHVLILFFILLKKRNFNGSSHRLTRSGWVDLQENGLGHGSTHFYFESKNLGSSRVGES